MSRVGKEPITIPSGVTVDIKDGAVTVRGSKGELTETVNEHVSVAVEDGAVIVKRNSDSKTARSAHGLMRSLIANMIQGVNEGFTKVLEFHGVGFRANMAGTTLKLSVGFSHDAEYEVPAGIQVSVQSNEITVTGVSKQQVGQVAAEIRSIKKPEPYKAKGIRYQNERIIRKAGKTAG